MPRKMCLIVAGLALALGVPAATSGAAGKFVRVTFPTIVSVQTPADPGLCAGGAWQLVGKKHGDPFKSEKQCVKYAVQPAVFHLPSYSGSNAWAMLPAPFDAKVPTNHCTASPQGFCLVFYKGLQTPFPGKAHDFGVPEDPPAHMLSTSGIMLQGTVDSVDASGCPGSPGTLAYTASGRSMGPYPGTFTETGTITLGSGLVRRLITNYSVVLDIDSDVGQVHMTYSDPPPPPSMNGVADCLAVATLRIAHVSVFMGYHATITRPDGTSFQDLGDSQTTLSLESIGLITLAVSTFEGDAQSALLPSDASLPPPTPVCPPSGCE
jgi:hypothetical protein